MLLAYAEAANLVLAIIPRHAGGLLTVLRRGLYCGWRQPSVKTEEVTINADAECQVVVVGTGNAGLCAAIAASQAGARVILVEAGPEDAVGGNSAETEGAFRAAYDGVEDLRKLMPHLSDVELAGSDWGHYSTTSYLEEMRRAGDGRADPTLIETLATESFDAMIWLRELGVVWTPLYDSQVEKHDGRFAFRTGLVAGVRGGGGALIETLFEKACELGVETRFDHEVVEIHRTGRRVDGVSCRTPDGMVFIDAGAVVVAAGGFEANPQWRTSYLGERWALASVRGTEYNQGRTLDAALAVGAVPYGNWAGCHAVPWEANNPATGARGRERGSRYSYPLSIMVNSKGERFVDEGASSRVNTYSKYGRAILAQPGAVAWQIFDSQTIPYLREEYRNEHASVTRADTLQQLATLTGIDPEGLLTTVRQFNAAVDDDIQFDPWVNDHKSTSGLEVNKSNWAVPIVAGPFEAYKVTCGITFTFGGLGVDHRGRVLDAGQQPIPGLFACGETVGGLFSSEYLVGAGLSAGAVIGRIAGRQAASNPPAAAGTRARATTGTTSTNRVNGSADRHEERRDANH